MEISEIIAQNLKRLRLERNLSLGQLSDRSGVSKVMLSQIEKGDSNPTVSTLFKIVSGLGVSYSALMDQQAPQASVVRSQDVPTQTDDEGSYRMQCYFPNTPERGFEVYRDVVDPQSSHETDGHGPGTEEIVYVIRGKLSMTVGGDSYELQANDAIDFDASQRHVYGNKGDEPVEMVVINRYPNR